MLPGFVDFVKLNKWRDYLDKRAADLLRWSNVVEDYDETILNPFLPEVNNPLWDYIENNLNEAKQKVVADFGCGNGKFVKFLCEEKKIENVYGIDYSDNMLKSAKKRNKSSYLFSIDTKFEEKLNNGSISEELKKEFKKNRFSLPDNASVKKEEEKKWAITDEKKFIIRKEEGKLNIYKSNVTFLRMDMTRLEEEMGKKEEEIYGKIDIAFSINSILPRNPKDTPIILHEIYNALTPGGIFIAIVPAFDTVLYLKELWYERRIERLKERYKHSIKKLGSKLEAIMDTRREFYKCRKLNKRKQLYADDFSNVQRFIHDNKIQDLLKDAGFELLQKEKVTYPWELCKKYNYDYFPGKEEIWDWFVVAEKLKKEN